MSCMKCLSKCFCSKKPVLPWKISGCAPVTFNLTFHPNFHPNIWVFANLPIYRKLIHETFALETLVSVILNVLFLVINIGITISVSFILKKIKFIVIPIYLHCGNIPEGYSSNSSKISDCVNIVEITATQRYTRIV